MGDYSIVCVTIMCYVNFIILFFNMKYILYIENQHIKKSTHSLMDLVFDKIDLRYLVQHGYKKFPLKKISDEYLPLAALMDRVYLVKKNSIIEFNNCLTYESRDIRWMPPEITRKTEVTMCHIDTLDIMDYLNIEHIKTGEEMTSHDVDKSLNFMKVLLKIGFSLYIRDV